jgi:phage baseplate assembly protein gpV
MAGGRGAQRALRELADDGRTTLEIGTITEIATHAAWGYLLTLEIEPDGREVQARPIYAGAGASTGSFWPVAEGDEALVLCPGGDVNRAMAICGLTSSQATPPSDWDNDQPQETHANGRHFRTAEAAAVQKVVTEDFLSDLIGVFTEIESIGAAMTPPVATTNTAAMKAQLGTAFRSSAIETE